MPRIPSFAAALVLLIGAPVVGASPQDADTATRRLQKARQGHLTLVAKLKTDVLVSFAKAIEDAIARGEEEQGRALMAERREFEKSGTAPSSEPMAAAGGRYERAKTRADEKLVASYESAIRTLEKLGDREGAAQLRKELREFKREAGLGVPSFELRGHSDRVNAVTFAPDGKTVASGSSDDTVRIWDLETRETVHVLGGHRAKIRELAFTPDGDHLLSGAHDGTVRVWSTKTGESRASYDVAPRESSPAGAGGPPRTPVFVSAVAVAADGRRIAAGTDRGTLILGELKTGLTGPRIQLATGRGVEICGIRFLPDPDHAVASCGTFVSLVDLRREREILRMKGPRRLVTGVDLSADGRFVLGSSWDGSVRLWSLRGGREVREFAGFTECVHAVSFSPDGKLAAAAGGGAFTAWNDWRSGQDHSVRVWEMRRGREVFLLEGHTEPVLCLAFSPDGKRIASGGKDMTVRVWSLPQPK